MTGKGSLGQVPDPLAEPGLHRVVQAAAGRSLGVVAGPDPLQVDHAAVERQGLERRPGLRGNPLAERLGDRQAAQLALERHSAGGQVDRPR